jgi:DNA-directed RNA polymerase subunit RPC12/RpoP
VVSFSPKTTKKTKINEKLEAGSKADTIKINDSGSVMDKIKSSVSISEKKDELVLEKTNEQVLVSSDEIDELENQDIFTNGTENGDKVYTLDLEEETEGKIVCSECGALIDPEEITDEGCKYCGGNIIVI